MDLAALFLNPKARDQSPHPVSVEEEEPAEAVKTGPVQQQVRLLEHQVLDLVARYVAGATVPDLVTEFGINRTTVLRHLDRHDVPRRAHQRKLTDAMVVEAIELYNCGWSYLRLGER